MSVHSSRVVGAVVADAEAFDVSVSSGSSGCAIYSAVDDAPSFASMKSNLTGVRPDKIVRLAEELGDMLELCVASGAFGGSHCGWLW